MTDNFVDYKEWSLDRLFEPDIEPVTVAEAKANSRIDISDDDTLISSLIKVARIWVEDHTGRALIEQTRQLTFQGYASTEFRLHCSPVISIDSFIYNESGTVTTLASDQYELVGAWSKWPKLMAAYNGSFPSSNFTRPLTVQFKAGFARRSISPTEGAEKVPEEFKQAIKLLVGYYYENREAVGDPENVPTSVKSLLISQRCNTGFA